MKTAKHEGGNVNVRLGDRARSLDVHPCAIAPDCRVRVRTDVLMCGPHWRLVPAARKTEVYAAYRAWRRSGILTEYDALRKAQERAVVAVRTKLKGWGKRV